MVEGAEPNRTDQTQEEEKTNLEDDFLVIEREAEQDDEEYKRELAKRLSNRTSSVASNDSDAISPEEAELQEYISEMLLLISTGDDEVDLANIELVADNIHTKAVEMHNQLKKHLEANQKQVSKEIKKSKEEENK